MNVWPAHPDQPHGNKFFAQRAEDIVVLEIFQRMGIEKPTFLDIGAHHPFNGNNTGLLHLRGAVELTST
jgi:hypothetical protein